MDRFEIETALTSLAQPGVQFCKPAAAKTLARRCNDYAAELNAKHGKRFGAFGTVSMWDVGDAVEEIGYALDTLKFSGVSLFASYDGKFLGDARFDPVMEALNARDGVVFVHPGAHPTNKLIDLPWPGFMMEYLFDTTRAVVNLMFGGALERYPRIRFILPHAGGLVPYFSWRLSVSPMIDKRLTQMSQDEVFGAAQALLVRQRALARRADLGLPAERGIARPDRVRHRLAVRQRARHRRRRCRPTRRSTRSRRRSAPPSTGATRCGCSRSSRDRDALEPTARPRGGSSRSALGLIALITPLAVHLFFPVIPAVKVALGLADACAQLTFSIALFGMAFATLFYGSLSDRYGRRPVLLSGLALFLLGSVISALAQTPATLVLGRLVQAIGAGCG